MKKIKLFSGMGIIFVSLLLSKSFSVVAFGLTNSGNIAQNSYQNNYQFSREQIDYFLEVAMGSEFSNHEERVRKWEGSIRIQVLGKPTSDDRNTLLSVVEEINSLTAGSISLSFDDVNPNLKIYFVPESNFAKYESNYRPRNYGFFWTYWHQNQVINQAKVLISTEGVTQKERSHLIREELTQSLGLMRDSERYQDSIFYQQWTDITVYSPMDKALIKMLYSPQIKPGMTSQQVRQFFLHQWTTNTNL